MAKKLIVLAGVSGVGKTYTRTHDPRLKDLPCVDMADVYRDHPLRVWPETYYIFEARLDKTFIGHDTVVAEGYFLPGSTTRNWLANKMRRLGIEMEFIDLHAALSTCEERIAASGENVEPRLQMLKRVWPKANEVYSRRES